VTINNYVREVHNPSKFDVYVTVHHWYTNINSQLDAKIIIFLIISISSTCFRRYFRPSSGALDCVYSLWCMPPAGDQDAMEPHPGHQLAAYTTSCKHSLVLLRIGESVAGNMLNWLKLFKKLLLLHRVGCLYIYFFCPMPPHVLMDFVVLPTGHDRSVTDFWGWDAHEVQLRCPDDVSGDIGRCSARRALKPKFY